MRDILTAVILMAISGTSFTNICVDNSVKSDLPAVLAWCIPEKNPLCMNDQPVTWPQVNATEKKVVNSEPTNLRVSSSADELVWNPIETYPLKAGQAVQLYKDGSSLKFRVIDAKWCNEEIYQEKNALVR